MLHAHTLDFPGAPGRRRAEMGSVAPGGVTSSKDGDGGADLGDARLLAAIVERLSGSSWYRPFEGGLGLYRGNRAHGPFLHVDVRGHRARWGE